MTLDIFEAGSDGGDYFGSVFATEKVFYIIGQGSEEAVGGFAEQLKICTQETA